MKNVNTPPLLQWELGGSLSFTQSLTEKKKHMKTTGQKRMEIETRN